MKAGSLELHPHFPHGWQGPEDTGHFSLLSEVRLQRAGSEVESLGLEWLQHNASLLNGCIVFVFAF